MMRPPAHTIDIAEIKAMLDARAEALARELLPNGWREGHEYRTSNLADVPNGSSSLAVHIGGAKAGWWKDFSSGQGGDLLKLIAAVLFRDDLGKAVAWAKSWLGLDDADPARLRQHRAEALAAAEKRAEAARAAAERTRGSARKRWLQGSPIAGTIVETYLARRGIEIAALGRAPGVLRFNPAVQYGYGEASWTGPAMLAAVTSLAGEHVATHRTWLAADGSGKAPCPPAIEPRAWKPKKVLGLYEGAHIPLWKGASGDRALKDVPAGTDVWVSEGIEDGLTAACADPSLRVIAGISVSNLAVMDLPAQMGWLVFLRQNDPPGSDADKAFWRAVAAQRARGRKVKVASPPRSAAKDINELAQRAMEAAVA